MKLEKYFKQVIVENTRFNLLLDKFTNPREKEGKVLKPIMDVETYYKIILGDPTTKKPRDFNESDLSVENYSNLKPGEYTNWLLKNYTKPALSTEDQQYEVGSRQYKESVKRAREVFLEDLFKTTSDLTDFNKYKNILPVEDRNIDNYTPSTLFDYMFSFEVPQKYKKQEEKKEIKKQRKGLEHSGATLDFQSPKWSIMKIEDTGAAGYDAALWFGGFRDYKHGETNWCTSETNPSWNAFNTFIKDGPLYVIIPNSDSGGVGERTGLPTERFQFHFPSDQFMDRLDKRIDLATFLKNEGEELKEYFKPEFAKGLISTNSKKVQLEYPTGSVAKFIGLYGFDEFFINLPRNITQLLFTNKSNENLNLTIPEEIGEFTELESILLQKCVKKLPESIGKLKKLTFISLVDSKSLEQLPESITDLPNLSFVYLKDTPVKLSDKFLRTFSEEVPGSRLFKR